MSIEANIQPDPRLVALARNRANELLQQVAAPLLAEKARIYSLYGQPRMVISKDGQLIEYTNELTVEGQKLMDPIHKLLKQCEALALHEFHRILAGGFAP